MDAERKLSATEGKVWGEGIPTALKSCVGGAASDDLRGGSPRTRAVIAKATGRIGEPYVWGGGAKNGPTGGGWDCSGLMVYAVHQGTGGKVTLPRTSQEQRHVGRHMAKDKTVLTHSEPRTEVLG